MTFTENPIYVLAVLCLMVILATYTGKTKLGGKLGAALLVILFTAVFANLKLIPSASNSISLYRGIFTYLAPISIFYLLLNVNIQSIKKAGAPMIILFLMGSLATVLGILAAWYLITPEKVLGENAHIIAGMLTGTYTGGSVNFNAVALEYDFQEQGALYAGTIAVDNVVTATWIIINILFPVILRNFWKDKKIVSKGPDKTTVEKEEDKMDFTSFMWLLFLGIAAFHISEWIGWWLPDVPFILILSTLGIVMAQIPLISKLKGSHTLGLYLIFLFLAVIGAYCEIGAVVELKEVGWTLFLFTSLAVLIHGVVIILLGGISFRDWEMVAIASQANIGGSSSAIALAESFKRKELILPGILVGTLGNALGTYLGFLMVGLL